MTFLVSPLLTLTVNITTFQIVLFPHLILKAFQETTGQEIQGADHQRLTAAGAARRPCE